jgi:hypothetical protein
MSNNDIKSKVDDFYFICKGLTLPPADTAVFGISLSQFTRFSLISLIIQEPIFHIFFWSYYSYRFEIWHIHFFLYSIWRIVTCLCTENATRNKDFDKCIKSYKCIKLMTLIQSCHLLLLFLMVICDIQIGWRHPPENPLVYVTALLITAMNFYKLYIIFSFIHHLGDGNIELIDGKALRLNATSNYGEILVKPVGNNNVKSVNIGTPGQTQICVNMDKDENGEFSMTDRVTLTNSLDITFAQSAQNAVISEVTLPSGVKVPAARDGKNWRIVGNEILLI